MPSREGEPSDAGETMDGDDIQGGTTGGGPGAYGDQHSQDGVEFVVLNDDVLTSVANATMVLIDGSDLERMAVLYQFPQFLEHCPDDSVSIMVPVICNSSLGWKEDVQMAAAEALYFVVNMPLPETVAKQIVVCALSIIQTAKSGGEVFDACGEILSMMLPQVKRQDVLELVVPATSDRANSNTPESRRLAARIIGSLNDSMTADEIENMFLKQALELAADEDPSVRAMIAQSMAAVGSKLPLRVSEKHIWPKLKTLMKDSNARVRAAAMRAIARSAEAHKSQASKTNMYQSLLMPMFLAECSKASEVAATDLRSVDDDTYLMLEIFSEVYGYFLCAVSALFQSEDTWTAALNTLRRMVTCNGPTVRHWCAFNIPAVATVCAVGRTDKIKGVVQALSVDSDVETRATLAAGIHESTRLLGDGPLRDEIVQSIGDLMTDSNLQVRMNSLTHFSLLLTLLATSSGGTAQNDARGATNQLSADGSSKDENSSVNIKELGPIFTSLEVMSMDSWRTQELLATELKKSAHLIPQEMLCEHVAPLLFQMARESTFLVRRASMQALIHVIRYIPDVRRRDHILKHFKTEWARGKVYWTRLAYIDGTECAHEVLSSQLFTQLFQDDLIAMTKDPVPNVRLRLVRFFSALASIWKDSKQFQEALEALTRDADPQVSTEARMQLKALASAKERSADQITKDKRLEMQEQAFFVHRPAKKKKGASTADTKKPTNAQVGQTGSKFPPAGREPVLPSGPALVPEYAEEPASPFGKQIEVTPSGGIDSNRRESGSVLKKGLCGCFGGG
jgi:HEAT repeats